MTTRVAARRSFSILTAVRSAARSMESHPFQRPAAMKPAKADWGKMVKRSSGNFAAYAAGATVLLGWPIAAKKVFDGHVGHW